jgi:hypothetical protein
MRVVVATGRIDAAALPLAWAGIALMVIGIGSTLRRDR